MTFKINKQNRWDWTDERILPESWLDLWQAAAVLAIRFGHLARISAPVKATPLNDTLLVLGNRSAVWQLMPTDSPNSSWSDWIKDSLHYFTLECRYKDTECVSRYVRMNRYWIRHKIKTRSMMFTFNRCSSRARICDMSLRYWCRFSVTSRAAQPRPQIIGVFSVPGRKDRSCPPPNNMGYRGVAPPTSLTNSAPVLGP